MSLLQVAKLSISLVREQYQYVLLKDISFSIEAGQTFALIGESGCGKSLTALALMQLLPPGLLCHQHSRITLAGNELLTMSEAALRSLRGHVMSLVFQEPMTALNPVKTIYQQLKEVVPATERASEYLSMLMEKVELTETARILKSYPHELSGGQKQRVMIAMAIANRPKLLIADEPTTALDPTVQQQILALLKRLQAQEGIALLMITHDYDVVRQMADDVGVMYAGQLVELQEAHAFDRQQCHPYSQRLIACRPQLGVCKANLRPIAGDLPDPQQPLTGCAFSPRCDHVQDVCRSQIPPWQALSGNYVGFQCHFTTLSATSDGSVAISQPSPQSIDLLSVNALTVDRRRHGQSHRIVEDISFSIKSGETLGLIGESGCGKSTLCLAIMQLLPVTSGDVIWQHKPLVRRAGEPLPVQMIFQDPTSAMNPRWLVQDILLEGVHRKMRGLSRQQQQQRVVALLDQVGLAKASLTKYPHEFSGGQRQRLVIARALAVSPRLLICDEPTSALDVSVQAQILNLFDSLQRELGVAYLFVSHDINVIHHVADRVMVMKAGKIVEAGTASQVLLTPTHAYTQRDWKCEC